MAQFSTIANNEENKFEHDDKKEENETDAETNNGVENELLEIIYKCTNNGNKFCNFKTFPLAELQLGSNSYCSLYSCNQSQLTCDPS